VTCIALCINAVLTLKLAVGDTAIDNIKLKFDPNAFDILILGNLWHMQVSPN